MTNAIKHQGIVESTNGSRVRVRIVQTSACVSCSIKGHCSSADAKEKIIDVVDTDTTYRPGDKVWVFGEISIGIIAVSLAFILPFLILVISLFVFNTLWDSEFYAAICSLLLLIPYYYILWLNKARIGKKISFTLQPMD